MQNTNFKDFPKNYDYKSAEKRIAEYWESNNIYKFKDKSIDKDKDSLNGDIKEITGERQNAPAASSFCDSNSDSCSLNAENADAPVFSPTFSIDTPPPYVSSAHLHVGHAMSYSQAEFIIRYKRMKGFNIFYPMGFDDNGLPTERYVEKKYKINKSKITRDEFIDLCLKETKIGINTYKELWQALGISVDWDLTYSTIDGKCRKTSQKSFIELYDKKLVERRNEPIIWCPLCRTSLAQADITIEEFDGVLYDIEFISSSEEKLIISTTRPELLGACVAIYANPSDSRYLHLKDELIKIPIYNHTVPVKFDESVETEYGTGLMMVCTWGDAEDVKKWKEHKLETAIIIEPSGKLNEKAGDYKGISVKDAKKVIVEDLKKLSLIKNEKKLKHNVGIHDRCSTAVEFIQTPQWFIPILDYKDKFIEAGNKLNWYPAFMKTRYDEWVQNIKWDWNISRQRFYGVPFPVWYCSRCNQPIIAKEDELPVDPVVSRPKHTDICPICGNNEFIPEKDVMDTWMTSSMTPFINSNWANFVSDDNNSGHNISKINNNDNISNSDNIKGRADNIANDAINKNINNDIIVKNKNIDNYNLSDTNLNEAKNKKIFPMTLRPQAQEIIRTWLFYTVVKSIYHTGDVPFENVMISGWGLDKSGKKMSKSLGNFVAPEEIIEKYSADALRYWAAKANLGQDLRFSEEDVANGRRLLIKIWNAVRFLATNIDSLKSFSADNADNAESELLNADLADVNNKDGYNNYNYNNDDDNNKFSRFNRFNPYKEDISKLNLPAVDSWLLTEFEKTLKLCGEYFESYEYSSAIRTVGDFFYNIYCDNYLEIIKNIFWEESPLFNNRKIQSLNVMYYVSFNTLKLFAPFLPFISEELYLSFYKHFEIGKSIHLSAWPEYRHELINETSIKQVNVILAILESSRKLRTNLNLHQNHKVKRLFAYSADEQIIETIQNLSADIMSACRAEELVISNRADFRAGNAEIFISFEN